MGELKFGDDERFFNVSFPPFKLFYQCRKESDLTYNNSKME